MSYLATDGRFTGAVAARAGALEDAGRGTLLLDEIGELSLASQTKLLQLSKTENSNGSARIARWTSSFGSSASTNRNLEEMVAARQFRSDLFFRISVVRAQVPALRERGEDLLLLAKQMLTDIAQTAGRRVAGFTPEALETMRKYAWPGNVRELRNAIEHAVALGDDELVAPRDLPPGIGGRPPQPEDPDLVRLPLDLASLEKRAIDAALRQTQGNRIRAAALLGINRTTLYLKLKQTDE